MTKTPVALAVPALAAAALAAGCFGSGGAGGPAGPGAAGGSPGRPAFLAYETSVRRIMVNDLGRETEVRSVERVSVRAGAMRTEDSRTGGADVLRPDRKLLWHLEPARRLYAETSFREMAAAADAGRRKVVAILLAAEESGSDPARRKRLETILGKRQPAVEVKEDPERQTILGHPCRHLRFYEDGELRIDGWAAEDLELPCDLGEFMAVTGEYSPGLIAELKRRPGLFLRKRNFGRMLLSEVPRLSESEVTQLETPAAIDPALFEVPRGYTRAK